MSLLQALGVADGCIAVAPFCTSDWQQGGNLAASVYDVANSSVATLRFRPQSSQLAIGCEDGSLLLWDACSHLELCQLGLHRTAITCCEFGADSWLLVAGDASGLVSIWDLRQDVLIQIVR